MGHDGRVSHESKSLASDDHDWQNDAPLFAAWRRFVEADTAPFAIPGHKRKAHELDPMLGRLLDADVPLYGGADNTKPTGILADAERRAALLWGADHCRFTTQGSTHANQVMVRGVCAPGDTVLVTRNCHRSVLSGLALANARPVWLPVAADPATGVPLGVQVPTLERTLAEHPEATAVFLTDPSYQGTLGPLGDLVDLAHAADLTVVVDQAWGAHLGLAHGLPRNAIQHGADAMVTSAHKMLPAFSQAAVILTQGDRIDEARIQRAYDSTLTTSPSAAIMASIDAARAWVGSGSGRAAIARTTDLVINTRDELRAAGFSVPGADDFPGAQFDPMKLVVHFTGGGSGLAAEEELLLRGIPLEMADRDAIVAQVGLLDDEATMRRLIDGIVAGAGSEPARPVVVPDVPLPPTALTPGEAFAASYETVPADMAVGRVSAELIAPYPPGVAVIVPGEVVTAESMAALLTARDAGNRIAYAADPSLATLQVVVDPLPN